ncbi:fungal specific transcription factor domain-containing protein [Aspergillus thermomutatus]|uniref:Transcription factor domain-containing protein n=1 Tax=Aspergillus thermomutatus TaxID=41047 RepID=A0A397HMP3_ASPTH|nr:uncharacterized protein CDV56_106321 [Aspergillus thermomutatus]RHZ64435.1 hypothetical protein CDV56_106321 [Aspergillus thermomutatus]
MENPRRVSPVGYRKSAATMQHRSADDVELVTFQKRYRYYRVGKDAGRPSRSASPEQQARNRITVGEQRPSLEEEGTSPDLSPSGYVGSSSILSICPRFSPVISRKPIRPLDKDSSQFEFVKQLFMKLLASSECVEQLILQYYDSSRFTVIPRPLILDPITKFLRELGASEDEGAFLDNQLANARRNLHKRFPSLSAHTTATDFLGYFNGDSFRLEFVGLIFALAGVSFFYTEVGDVFDQQNFAAEMYTASKVCVGICEEYNQVNDLTVWSRYMNFILASNLFGDASNILYHRANEFIAELFVMGFHRLVSSPPNVPFFILETRKRIFASAVTRDKSLSTFLGRAPRIDCDFCDLTVPSDLDDDDVLLEGSRLDAALQDLDRDGWKRPTGTNEPFRPASLIRLRYQQAHLREKVLRLSLGNKTKSYSETLSGLYEEYHNALARVPSQYRYRGSAWGTSNPRLCVARLIVHLDYLYSGFLIERMLTQDGQMTMPCLLATSAKLLSGVLEFVQQQHCYPELRERFTWMFLFYGLPGAGTLATELHHSTLRGVPLQTSIPCANIIRDLSVLLAWFERKSFPDRPDFQVCVQISKVIGALLDDTLNRGLPSSQMAIQPERQQLNQHSPGLSRPHAADPVVDATHNALEMVQPLPDAMTSQDFLSWFDDLVWDDPSMSFDSIGA